MPVFVSLVLLLMGSCSAIRKRPVQCLQAHCSSCASLCSACSQAVPAGSRAVSAVTLFHLKAGQSLNPSKIFSAASPPTAVLDICVKNFQNAAACALAGLLVFQTERAERRKPFLGPARPRSKQFPSKQNAVHFSAAIFARPRLSTPARNPRERERERTGRRKVDCENWRASVQKFHVMARGKCCPNFARVVFVGPGATSKSGAFVRRLVHSNGALRRFWLATRVCFTCAFFTLGVSRWKGLRRRRANSNTATCGKISCYQFFWPSKDFTGRALGCTIVARRALDRVRPRKIYLGNGRRHLKKTPVKPETFDRNVAFHVFWLAKRL